MRRKKNNQVVLVLAGLAVIALAVIIVVAPGRKGPSGSMDGNEPQAEPSVAQQPTSEPGQLNSPARTPSSEAANPGGLTQEQAPPGGQKDATPATPTPLTSALKDLVAASQTWMPCDLHAKWFGKAAPDLTVMDLDVKQHKLSNYRGKKVVILLWAPSFAPSLRELGVLTQLRQAVSQEQLVILAMSFDSEVAIRRYVESQPSINYPVIAAQNQDVPSPYSEGKPMPCSIFITQEGTFKISVRGMLSLEDYQALLQVK